MSLVQPLSFLVVQPLRLAMLTAILLTLATINTANAAPSFGEEMSVRQPDGTEVTVKAWGDEFYMRLECVNGYTLTHDADRWLVYAKLSDDGNEFVSTEIRYTANSTPPIDVPKGLRINESAVREIRRRAMEESGFDEMMREGPRRHPRVKSGLSRSVDGISAAPIEPEVVVGLVIVVEFQDVKAIHTLEHVDELFKLPYLITYRTTIT
jgi:hypothetical protein